MRHANIHGEVLHKHKRRVDIWLHLLFSCDLGKHFGLFASVHLPNTAASLLKFAPFASRLVVVVSRSGVQSAESIKLANDRSEWTSPVMSYFFLWRHKQAKDFNFQVKNLNIYWAILAQNLTWDWFPVVTFPLKTKARCWWVLVGFSPGRKGFKPRHCKHC